MTRVTSRRDFLLSGGGAVTLALAPRCTQSSAGRQLRATHLKVNYLATPCGVESPHPTFSWRLESTARNVWQSAYRIRVATTADGIRTGRPDLWDSGKVLSSRSTGIPYDGHPLVSRQRCWWSVQLWTRDANEPVRTSASHWEMGLLSAQDWSAQWIAADDEIARADRETKLHWMWGQEGTDARPRSFRLNFTVPKYARSGVIFTGGRGDAFIQRMEIDGTSLVTGGPERNLIGEHVELEPLSVGPHTLSIDVVAKRGYPEVIPGTNQVKGILVMARMDIGGGEHIRIGSGPGWQTAAIDEAEPRRGTASASQWSTPNTEVANATDIVVDPAMYLRRTFTIAGRISAARLYATALGGYQARLNGRRVGDALLSPEISEYSKRLLYRVHDVTNMVAEGDNVIALIVGDGWYASHPGRYGWGPPPRRAIAQLEILYENGVRRTVETGEEWRVSRSPIVRSELCVGEVYDSRLSQDGWDTAGFDDSHWEKVVLTERPPCQLVAHVSRPIRVVEELTPTKVTQQRPGVYLVDFGQNFAGWCRLRVKGNAGERVTLRFAEEVSPTGEIDQFVLLGGKAVDTYILRGSRDTEVFEPHFCYHGFRYAEMVGFPGIPTEKSLVGVVISSDLEVTAWLKTDDAVIGRIWRNTIWTQRSNFIGIPTDCPNRAERLGYLADAGAFWDTASLTMDVAAFTRRHMDNTRDAQLADGALPILAPGKIASISDGISTAAGWADGGIILPWTCWRRYGDLSIIEENWEAMDRYLSFLSQNNPDYIWRKKRSPDFGDWLAIGETHFYHPEQAPTTPFDLIATAYWANSALLLSEMAEATGRMEDAARLRQVRDCVRDAFNRVFVGPNGEVGNGSQTSYILALKFDLLSPELRRTASERLVTDIRRRGIALSTGYLGTQYSLDVLADEGHIDLVYSLLLRKELPSWGFMIENGATTMWERWDGSLDHTHNTASHNHFTLGAVCGAIFRRVAGIDCASAGFSRITIRPCLDPRVKYGGGELESVMGTISTEWWQLAADGFAMAVTIPPNAAARIHLPARPEQTVKEGRRRLFDRKEIHLQGRNHDEVVVEVGSGSYNFRVE